MRFLAKPRILNSKFDKTFKTEKEAVAFLEKETEHHMHKEDWKLIGKLIGGDISEDDALEILDNNLDILGMLGFDNKYDALAVVYQMTEQLYKERI